MQNKCENSLIPTFNQMGYAQRHLNEVTENFVKFAAEAKSPALDLGACFGSATLPALESGAKVIANDIDLKALKSLEKKVPQQFKNNLKTIHGAFPNEINFKPRSFSSILASQLIHFFDHETIYKSAQKMYEWLEPNGRLFIVVATVYTNVFEKIVPLYEANLTKGEKWPAEIHNLDDYLPEDQAAQLPSLMNFFPPETLREVFEAEGFVVDFCDFFKRDKMPDDIAYDGRENLGLIAYKPKS